MARSLSLEIRDPYQRVRCKMLLGADDRARNAADFHAEPWGARR